ncbi:MAG: thioredoxin-disulfide reductase [Chitinispirillaceae bacterium]|nr:thioredoxin-disulfide reductase [Chitinispirillaceae bacterium]
MENVVIAGSGPAGLTAAIYAARGGLNPLVCEGLSPGGQLTVSESVENFPGFSDPVSGTDIMKKMREQARRFGAQFKKGSVNSVTQSDNCFDLYADKDRVKTKTLIIAAGAEARRLDVPGEARFYGRGVSGCAICDGNFFRDKDVLVVVGGNTAIQDAIFLSAIAAKVTTIHRRSHFRADACEIDRVKKIPNIQWLAPWVVEEIRGNDVVSGAVLRNSESEEERTISCDGIFVAIGHTPKTEAFRGMVEMDNEGYIKVHAKSTATTTQGIFACGDVCDSIYRQAVVAAGQGCMAALDVQRYLRKEI